MPISSKTRSLDGVLELAAKESSFAEFLRSPIIDPKKRDASLVRMLMDQVEPVTLNFLRLLNNKGRLAALPGIVGGVMLAISRAIGETMIVVMAASTAANLSANPLDSMTTVTVQIVAMLTGEGSFDHPATLSAFALGFVLFMVTLGLNFVALRVVKRYREAYE